MPNIPRLKHAIEVLKKVDEQNRKFNLSTWVRHVNAVEPKDEWCGTTACACGYFALDKEFSSQGFQVEMSIVNNQTGADYTRFAGSITELNKYAHNKNLDIEYSVAYRKNKKYITGAFEAAAAFFEITRATARSFFSPTSYFTDVATGPKDVIKRIEEYILRHSDCT